MKTYLELLERLDYNIRERFRSGAYLQQEDTSDPYIKDIKILRALANERENVERILAYYIEDGEHNVHKD